MHACGVCTDGGRCFQSRVDTTQWQPLDETLDQSAKEILRGSLVEQDVPAEYDVAELSTTETDAESEPSVADARDSSAVEKACGTSGEEACRAVDHEEADSKTETPRNRRW